ncbi:condensation domain-containing protein [Anaerotignum sp.]|uniref:condensation domain-containing protein n=1 Tax=Anaerotignum sp. TaxID=2039241 RepID=UPI00289EF3AA|nr:condensation domain-containing protein [Anaerotignum sp.]
MRVLPICDEQKYIFDVNEAIGSIPLKISYSMEFSMNFPPEELSFAIDQCIKTADVFGARCLVQDGRQYMEFLPYQKHDIPVFHFSTEEDYHLFYKEVWATKINNREKLYYIFIYSIAGSYYGIHFSFNHLIFDGLSVLLLTDKIQKVLLLKDEEVKWHPFQTYLENIKKYNESEKYVIDKEFWEDRFLVLSNCEYLFHDVIDNEEAAIKEVTFQTSKKIKDELYAYCSKNNISAPSLIATVLADIINKKTGCKRFYFEIPIGNRLGAKEKNSLGVYEIGPPFIFDFTKYNNIFDLYQSVQKQSVDYYKHRNFDWNTKILSEEYEEKYGRYIPQFSLSYFCTNKKPSVSVSTLKHHNCETDFLPMTLYIADYLNWETIGFSYIYWENYFSDEEVIEIHRDIETGIAKLIAMNCFS